MNHNSTNGSLIKACWLLRTFSGIPNKTQEQRILISGYYKNNLNGEDLSKLDKSQIYCIAKRLYHQARLRIAPLSLQERSALATFLKYEKAKSLGDLDRAEELEERICIQLENENDESLVVQEIQRELFPPKNQEVQRELFPKNP